MLSQSLISNYTTEIHIYTIGRRHGADAKAKHWPMLFFFLFSFIVFGPWGTYILSLGMGNIQSDLKGDFIILPPIQCTEDHSLYFYF